MAKRRAVTGGGAAQRSDPPAPRPHAVAGGPASPRRRLRQWSLGLLAALLVHTACWPVDSVALEQGQGLYPCGLAIFAALLAWLARPAVGRGQRWPIDAAAWGLALWVVISIWGTDAGGNRRMAVNEAWLWIAGAATFTAARRCCAVGDARRAMVALIVAVSVGLAVHGWHQQWISLPQTRAEYRADPEAKLAELRLHAPPGSAARMMFENRLDDGGPTATFALANSLAAPLLLGGLLAAGTLSTLGGRGGWPSRLALAAAVLLTASMLLATHSRSAVAAAGLAAIALGGWRLRRGRPTAAGRESPRHAATRVARAGWARGRWWPAMAVVILSVAVGLLAYLFTHRELLERAPASVAVRLQYWRSTWAMAIDSPWFGCGPGNFQARYERYREPAASEQVAEPHNFVMETLAAGGFPAAGLLGCLMAMVAWRWWHDLADPQAAGFEDGRRAPAALLGAGVAIAGVYCVGFALRRLPDLEAHLFAVPAAVAVLVALRRWIAVGTFPTAVGGIAVAGLGIHLLAAGGWTVAGIAVPLWILAGSLLPTHPPGTEADSGEASASGAEQAAGAEQATGAERVGRGAIAALGLLLLFTLYGWGIRPVATVNRSMELAAHYLTTGRVRDAERAYRQAAAADRWDPQPLLELAQIYLGGLLHSPPASAEHGALRRLWSDSIRQAIDRGPELPTLRARVGDQWLRLYQRWGQASDLQSALQQYRTAAELAPASERLAAQTAVVLAQLQRPSDARRWAERAKKLSLAGGHIERQLSMVRLLVPQPRGAAAESQPLTAPAADLLANLTTGGNVPTE